MKRNRLGRRGGLPRDAEQLLWLANGLADSSSRAEDHFWDQRLADAVDGLLRAEDEEALTTALRDLIIPGLDHFGYRTHRLATWLHQGAPT